MGVTALGETYGAHGHLFRIDAPDPVAARASQVLRTLRTDDPDHGADVGTYQLIGGPLAWTLTYNGVDVGLRHGLDASLLLLHWHVNQRTIEASVNRRTTFHAAAARSPRGHGVLLAAPMESGKTTTVTGLLRAGWDFLTDEAAAVDPDGTAWAYPKPLTIDKGSWPLFPDLAPADADPAASSWLVPATETGCQVADHAALRMIVFPGYRTGAATTLEPLVPSAVALELAHSTFAFDRFGARDLGCVSTLARRLPAYRLVVGELTQAVALLNDLDRGLGDAA